jgi:hypothetical protein
MSIVTTVGGVDPGLVHTGLIHLKFQRDVRIIDVTPGFILGTSAPASNIWFYQQGRPDHIFIEGYKPRSHLATDKQMVEAVAGFRSVLRGTVLLNYGVKKVVRKDLMKLLEVWSFKTVTHHQDVRSAAYIALFGMLKDERLNRLLYDIVWDHHNGRSWTIRHH